MKEEVKEQLRVWAEKYNTTSFINNDPVQFPHRKRGNCKQDIEISGFITAYLSFGNRKQIIKTCNTLDTMMGHSPYEYVMSKKWEKDFETENVNSFYRMISHSQMNTIFSKLYSIYTSFPSMEDCVLVQNGNTPFERICKVFEISDKSPQKKINMFLRWMIRRDGIVDLGIWQKFSPGDLIIPLDTHVCRMAYTLGLTQSKSYTLSNTKTITNKLKEVFADDPCKGDFALFGYGVENKQ